jgi:hypothetical protein
VARRLDALPRKEAIDGLTMHAQDAPDSDRIEPAVVNETPDRLRMDAELVRDFANADEARVFPRRRHGSQSSQVPSRAGRRV